ncbi:MULTISPECIES: WD40 repeat domain-containing protein [unclassified Micromonospora]|uniref:WD40 repeat domain-containing protein n=1 Tax=unclassified Micromonospora TaxID=2617518 RepID=UPI0033195887
MGEELRNVLRDLGERMPPVRLGDDPWAAGRRLRRRARRRTAVVSLVAVLACALGVPVTLGTVEQRSMTGSVPDAVPRQIGVPYMWQATVEQDPPGRASLLFSGGDRLGLRGIDPIDHEGKVAVLGMGGKYRTLLYGDAERSAGVDVLLSPDSRYVADGSADGWVHVTDLITGDRRSFAGGADSTCCTTPVAWAPGGDALLVLHHQDGDPDGDGVRPSRLLLLDLATGASRRVGGDLGDRWSLRTGSLAAFSPDGTRIAVDAGGELIMLDRAGTVAWSRELGPDERLAGVGAFTPDGSAVAVFRLDGCQSMCDADQRAARTWRTGYVDAATGQDGTGPAVPPTQGQALRALGWSHGRALVALRYAPEPGMMMGESNEWDDTGYRETGHVQLVSLVPDGRVQVLLDPPDGVRAMDVARHLMEAGRFGGPADDPRPFPARPLLLLPAVPVLLLVVGGAVGALLWWRLRRRRAVSR